MYVSGYFYMMLLRVFFLCCFSAIVLPFQVSASQVCDSRIQPVYGNWGYQWRPQSKVCEGFYEAKVSSQFEVLSFFHGSYEFSDGRPDNLMIYAPKIEHIPGANLDRVPDVINVRALVLALGAHYRMDSKLSLEKRQLEWGLNEVIYPAGLTTHEIGVFGWFEMNSKHVYVPLSSVPDSKTRSGQMSLKVRPRFSVETIIWKSWIDGEDTLEDSGTLRIQPTTRGTVSIPLGSGPPAILNVEITAKERNRDRWIDPIRLQVFRVQ